MKAVRFTKPLAKAFLSLMLFLFLSLPCYAGEITGRIVAVSDGDTVTLLTPSNEQIKIRLAAIDAPEKNQPFGQKAKQMLSGLIFNREVRVEERDIDKYGRIVGRIILHGTDINLLMVSRGGAWAYRKYLGSKDHAFIEAEEAARNNKAGLWALQKDQIMPPWEWRHRPKSQQSGSSSSASSALTPVHDQSCAGKSLCGQMESCAEARFYLAHCGISKLDGDRDGMPCESLCR